MKDDLAREAQRGYALAVPAQVYERVYLCVFVFARIYMGGANRLSCLFLVRTG